MRDLMREIERESVDKVRIILQNNKIDLNVISEDYPSPPLMMAVTRSNEKIIELLLDADADPMFPNILGQTPLAASILQPIDVIFQKLLTKTKDVNLANRFGVTPLIVAVENAKIAITKLLLDRGADISDSRLFNFALKIKKNEDKHQIIKLLLEKGANANGVPNSNTTPIHSAVDANDLTLVNILLSNNADINKVCCKKTPLHIAISKNNLAMTTYLLKKGANLDASCFKIAIKNNNADLFKYFQEHSEKNLDTQNKEFINAVVSQLIRKNIKTANFFVALLDDIKRFGLSFETFFNCLDEISKENQPSDLSAQSKEALEKVRKFMNDAPILNIVLERNETEIFNFLIKKGSNFDSLNLDTESLKERKTKKGETALHVAVRKNHTEAVTSLLAIKADVLAKTASGENPLHIAVTNGYRGIVKRLSVEPETDVNARTDSGKTVIHIIAERNLTTVIDDLPGVDLDAKTVNNLTALHIAAQAGHSEVVQALIAKGAKTNEKTSDGQTGLHLAAEAGHTEIVQALIANGANINERRSDGQTALELATKAGHHHIMQILSDHDADVGVLYSLKDDLSKTSSEMHTATIKLINQIFYYRSSNTPVTAEVTFQTTTTSHRFFSFKPEEQPKQIPASNLILDDDYISNEIFSI